MIESCPKLLLYTMSCHNLPTTAMETNVLGDDYPLLLQIFSIDVQSKNTIAMQILMLSKWKLVGLVSLHGNFLLPTFVVIHLFCFVAHNDRFFLRKVKPVSLNIIIKQAMREVSRGQPSRSFRPCCASGSLAKLIA